jgi:hypothetical protein
MYGIESLYNLFERQSMTNVIKRLRRSAGKIVLLSCKLRRLPVVIRQFSSAYVFEPFKNSGPLNVRFPIPSPILLSQRLTMLF